MVYQNISVFLRNDYSSSIVIGSLSINPNQSVLIWDTINYESGIIENFSEIIDGIASFNENIGNRNLVMVLDTNDQEPQEAFDQFKELLDVYNNLDLAENGLSILRLYSKETKGLIISHNDLIDNDQNVHPQYVATDGSNSLVANLDLDGYNIINVNLVDGVDVSAHGSRHNPGGIDAVSTATAVAVGITNAEGTSTSLARADHTHQVTGLTIASQAQGDILYYNGSNWVRLAPGTSGQFLRTQGAAANPQWAAVSTGDVVGPASATDNGIARFNTTTGKLIQDSSVTIDDNGNIYLNADGSTSAAPRIFGAINFTENEAIRWEFGDSANCIQNIWGGSMTLYAYHTIVLRGDRNTVTLPGSDNESSIGVWIPNTVATSPALVVDGAVSQSASLQQWRSNGGTTLLSVDSSGNIVMAGSQTVDGVDVSAHAARHNAGGSDAMAIDAVAGTGSLRTLGTSATSACAGNDSRLSDDRTASGIRTATTTVAVSSATAPTVGQALVATSSTAATWQSIASKKTIIVEFTLTENVSNTTEWFTTWRSHGGDTFAANKRSGSTTGIQNANSCSPFIVPFNCTITQAVLTLKGAGVQSGSVVYPVIYQTDLLKEGFSSETKLSDIDFSISNSYSVGTYSVGNTNYTGSVSLSINVDQGDLLALKFINGNDSSIVGQTRNAFIVLVLEER
jgi:hypothetical protein